MTFDEWWDKTNWYTHSSSKRLATDAFAAGQRAGMERAAEIAVNLRVPLYIVTGGQSREPHRNQIVAEILKAIEKE